MNKAKKQFAVDRREERKTRESAFYRGVASGLWLMLRQRGWNASDLAEKIDVHPRTVQRWLDGKTRLQSSYTVMKILKVTGCPYEDIFPGMDRSEWITRLAAQGFGVVDIGRHVGIHPELVHLRLQQRSLECFKPGGRAA